MEVTAAADAESIELWRLINGEGLWVEADLVGGWLVALLPRARARRLRTELPPLLRRLEEAGVRRLRPRPWSEDPFETEALDLGITHMTQGETEHRGSIYPTIHRPPERSGGAVPQTGDPLTKWLDEWIRHPAQAHNLAKLTRSGAEERHLFVPLPAFAEAPFAVVDLLLALRNRGFRVKRPTHHSRPTAVATMGRYARARSPKPLLIGIA